jgi:hypothetical protein
MNQKLFSFGFAFLFGVYGNAAHAALSNAGPLLISQEQTPYEILKSNFDSGSKMDLTELPVGEDYKLWTCVGAKPDSTLENLAEDTGVPTVVFGLPTGEMTPDNGPLFPPQPIVFQDIWMLPQWTNVPTPDVVQIEHKLVSTQILTSPDLATVDFSSSTPAVSFFRSNNGMIFIKNHTDFPAVISFGYDYAYCYKK